MRLSIGEQRSHHGVGEEPAPVGQHQPIAMMYHQPVGHHGFGTNTLSDGQAVERQPASQPQPQHHLFGVVRIGVDLLEIGHRQQPIGQ